MGSCESDLQEQAAGPSPPKQPGVDALQFLNELPDGWLTAYSTRSLEIINRPGKIWGYWTDWAPNNLPTYYYAIKADLGYNRRPPNSWFPADGSYGSDDVKQARLKALSRAYGRRDRIDNPHFHCHDSVSALVGKTYFYDFDFNIVDREERIDQAFSLEAKREICGLVFMEAPLKYVPIGKNYLETEGPNKPYMVFAEPKHVVMFVRVNGSMIEYVDSPLPGMKCFLSWDLSINNEMDKCRYFNIFILARKNKATSWSKAMEYPQRCVEAFARLFSDLAPGQYNIEMWFQFAYNTKKVGLLTSEGTDTLANHGSQVYGGGPKVQRLLLQQTKSSDSESLILKPDDPKKIILSEIFSMGAFSVAVPEKHVFYDVMQPFYGYEEHTKV